MTTTPLRLLLTNGVVSNPANTPPVTTFLETHPGAYTTTRTHNNASFVLFWDRHLKRLAESVRILYNADPQLLFGPNKTSLPLPSLAANSLLLHYLVNDSMKKVLPIALERSSDGEELSITTLVSGNLGKLELEKIGGALDVSIYVGIYVPCVFGVRGNGAQLAVVGRGRDVAAAKYSERRRRRISEPVPKAHMLTTMKMVAHETFGVFFFIENEYPRKVAGRTLARRTRVHSKTVLLLCNRRP